MRSLDNRRDGADALLPAVLLMLMLCVQGGKITARSRGLIELQLKAAAEAGSSASSLLLRYLRLASAGNFHIVKFYPIYWLFCY